MPMLSTGSGDLLAFLASVMLLVAYHVFLRRQMRRNSSCGKPEVHRLTIGSMSAVSRVRRSKRATRGPLHPLPRTTY